METSFHQPHIISIFRNCSYPRGMITLRHLGFAMLILSAGASFSRADLLTPTIGTYKGTITHERSLTLNITAPAQTVTEKTTTHVSGFCYVPSGLTTPFMRLILPGRQILDLGLDIEITIDFAVEPPLLRVRGGYQIFDLSPVDITVKGDVITCVITNTDYFGDYIHQDVRTLRLTREH
jgi:hypothetical protein